MEGTFACTYKNGPPSGLDEGDTRAPFTMEDTGRPRFPVRISPVQMAGRGRKESHKGRYKQQWKARRLRPDQQSRRVRTAAAHIGCRPGRGDPGPYDYLTLHLFTNK